MVNLTIDDREITVVEGTTILRAAEALGIKIPTLCYHKRLIPIGSCRMCLVEVEGYANPMTACNTPVTEGIKVCTKSERVQKIRKDSLKLILVNHPLDCPICDAGGRCDLQNIVYELGIETADYTAVKKERGTAYSTPLIRYWPHRCIMCLRCVHACRNVTLGVLDVVGSGFDAQIAPVHEERCTSCGECLRLCPTGALTENLSRDRSRPWMVNRVKTTCTYCGCGCQLELNAVNNNIISVTSQDEEGTNQGSLCVKGRFGYEFIGSEERLTKPLIKKDGVFKEAEWDEALGLVAKKFTSLKAAHGADAIGGLSSARCTNEENYLFQKFMRAAIGTNNIDHCARLWHSSTVAGLAASFGSGAMTNPIADVLKSEAILVTGSNTTENHPIFANYIKEAVFKRGAKLIVIDPRKIALTEYANLWLRPKPGTDIAWINGLLHVLIKENLYDRGYLAARTEGFEELKAAVEKYNPAYVADITGIPAVDLVAAARLYGKARPASILYTMEITPHITGTNTVKSLANLAMLCGNVGVAGGGVNPLRDQSNVQGACDMGSLPDVLPAYQKVAEDALRQKFTEAWGAALSAKPGLTFVEMMQAAAQGEIKGMYVMGENPVLSDPDLSHVEAALKKLDFLVVQDIFLTETAKLAHVVLPSACFAEKEGTFTNSERMVQRVRKAVSAPGEAKADGEIIMELAKRCGYAMDYIEPRAIMAEISRLAPSYGGITYERLDKAGLQWPCPTQDHPGTVFLHKDRFTRGKGLFHAIDYAAAAEVTDADYPLILTTGCALYYHHTVTMTRAGKSISERCPERLVEISSNDAEKFGIHTGEMVAITSRRGSVRARAQITARSPVGVIFTNFPFHEAAVNLLTNPALGPWAKIPEYEVCAVRVEGA